MRQTLKDWCVQAGDDALIQEWNAVKNTGYTPESISCPVCANREIEPDINDLASTHPKLAAEWDTQRNGSLTPADVVAGVRRRVWWRCPLGHSYSATVCSRVQRGSGCPYCAGRRILPGFNDLETKQPKIAGQRHPALNGALTPQRVASGSRRRAWWQCAGRGRVNYAARYQDILDHAQAYAAQPQNRGEIHGHAI